MFPLSASVAPWGGGQGVGQTGEPCFVHVILWSYRRRLVRGQRTAGVPLNLAEPAQ